MTNAAAAEHEERHRLTAVQGLAALSLDALSSVAYGPEAILVVLVAAGATALHYSLPITGAIVLLLAALVVSYRQVIEAFPSGGGAYAVSKAHLGTQASLQIGQTPKPPSKMKSLVVVPVGSISRLTAAGINTAISLGDDVVAVTVRFTDPDDEAADVSFRHQWEEWHPSVPLITLRTTHRSITRPIVKYLCQLEEDQDHRLVVLIPEVQPPRFWDWVLFNQRGALLDRAIRRGTVNVVLCRLRYRLEQFAPHDASPAPSSDAAAPVPAPALAPADLPPSRDH